MIRDWARRLGAVLAMVGREIGWWVGSAGRVWWRHRIAATVHLMASMIAWWQQQFVVFAVLLVPVLGLAAWARGWANSYRRWLADPLDRFRIARRLRHEWMTLMESVGLARRASETRRTPVGDKADRRELEVPSLRKVRWSHGQLTAWPRLLTGQTVEDVELVADRLRVAVGAHGCRVLANASVTECRIVWSFGDQLLEQFDAAVPDSEAPLGSAECVPMGRTEDGRVWWLPITMSTLVAGSSGSGKASLIWGLIFALGPQNAAGLVQLHGVDLKGGMEFSMGRPLFTRYAQTAELAVAMLEDDVQALQARAERLAGRTRQHVQSVDEPTVIIVIDELAALIAYSPDRDLTRRAEAALSVILSQGRAVGYVVFAFLQDPRKETVRMRHLFTQSIGLRLRDREEVTMVLGDGALRRSQVPQDPTCHPRRRLCAERGRLSSQGPGRLRQRRHDPNGGRPFPRTGSDPRHSEPRSGDAGASLLEPVTRQRPGDQRRRGLMVEPTSVGELLPGTIAEMAARAGRPDFDRWAAQAKGCGHCAHPIRLRGSTRTHLSDGRLVDCYSTVNEPDGVAYVRCGNRRAAVCQSCSHEYQGDMWHLLYAGVAGGIKGVPETVAEHPMVFATLTAPSFGAVHTTRGRGRRCHPPRHASSCPHGRPASCSVVHAESDPELGSPLCPDCYDYPGHLAFNWYAPELWRRFTIALRRRISTHLGVGRSQLKKHLVVSFAKVAEFQRRGIVHFHALIRLDGPADPYAAPGVDLDATVLGRLIVEAAGSVRVTTDPYTWGGPVWDLGFGDQCDVRPVHGRANRDAGSGPMHPEMVAAYIAKYATKAADDFGLLHRRLPEGGSLERLNVSDHTKRLLRTAIAITGQASAVITALEEDADSVGLDDTDNGAVIAAARTWLPIVRWLHMLGFRGHFSTKSRAYSVTMGALRAERRAWRESHGSDRFPLDGLVDLDELEESTLVVVRGWSFDGAGWLTSGDAAFAASAAARARARREAARLADGPPDPDDCWKD